MTLSVRRSGVHHPVPELIWKYTINGTVGKTTASNPWPMRSQPRRFATQHRTRLNNVPEVRTLSL